MTAQVPQLRWRNPRPLKEVKVEEPGSHEVFPVSLLLEVFMERWDVTIPNRHRDKWRVLFPNVGELDGFPHFGKVYILATDGVLAYYHVDFSGSLFLGHLKAFNGPIAKEYVYEDDWDYVTRRRKVNVFRRKDGTYAVIPKDTFWDEYWAKHERVKLHDDDEEVFVRKVAKSKRQLLLESL